ncbi:MAG: Eco57I restriction-modification methylase domain-containing protein, partial [Planctomycetota bacterium]
LNDNLYGVDLSPEAVEITQLALWIRSARPGQTLATLSRNIVHGNSLVGPHETIPHGFDWADRFPEVFDRDDPGFDIVLGNPPWERIKLQEREFFSVAAPEIATAPNAARRRKLVTELAESDAELHARYRDAGKAAGELLDYCRKSGEFPLAGKGDINLYAVFAELADRLVNARGVVGLLVPSGIASDKTTKDFFASLADSNRLKRLYDFENKKVFFPEVDGRFRFSLINFGGADQKTAEADFAFFLHDVEELEQKRKHIPLSGDDLKLINPNTRTCPIFVSRRDAEITKAIYRRVPVLIDRTRKGPTGNPWGVTFKTLFHQTNDAELFREPAELDAAGFRLDGPDWVKGEERCVPLYEAKMFRPYDHRHGSVFEDTSNWINQGQTHETTPAQHANPEFLARPRWWVDAAEITAGIGENTPPAVIGFRDITRATDSRT